MPEITITLNEKTLARLREVAIQRGEPVEQTAEALIESTLPPEPSRLSPNDPTGFEPLMSLFGTLEWPEGMGPVGTNEDIDRILAEEYMNPHDDEP